MRYFIAILISLVFCGCASVDRGRFSIIDLDLRTPEQIIAGTPENTVIYNSTELPSTEARVFPFEYLFKFLEVVKGRLRIISIEWKTK